MISSSKILKIFQSKIYKTLELINRPLVIFNLDGQNKNYKMFTLIEDHTAPSVLVLLPNGKIYIIISPIETAMLSCFGKNIKIYTYSRSSGLLSTLKKILPSKTEIYVEISKKYSSLDILTYGFFQKLKNEYKLISAEEILFELRVIKTPEEIELIKKTVHLTKDILKEIELNIKSGIREDEIMEKINLLVIKNELGFSFKPIIASGKRASDPHPVRFTKRALKKNDLLILDLGLYYHCYTSDITRTYKIDGNIEDEKFFQVNQEMVQKLLSLKISDLFPYELGNIMDAIAKKYKVHSFQKHGYGHGVGLDIHDIYPSIVSGDKKYNVKQKKFADNMVFAFEPGFYTKQKSFRIENNYMVCNGYAVEL